MTFNFYLVYFFYIQDLKDIFCTNIFAERTDSKMVSEKWKLIKTAIRKYTETYFVFKDIKTRNNSEK